MADKGKPVPSTKNGETPNALTPELMAQIGEMRSKIQMSIGQTILAIMDLPRYKHMTVGDLSHLIVNPLLRNRVAIAHKSVMENGVAKVDEETIAGIAIWATVSDAVDAKISEQIKAGVFPIRLAPEEWTSGELPWLLDVIAADRKQATAVLANFRQLSLKNAFHRTLRHAKVSPHGAGRNLPPKSKTLAERRRFRKVFASEIFRQRDGGIGGALTVFAQCFQPVQVGGQNICYEDFTWITRRVVLRETLEELCKRDLSFCAVICASCALATASTFCSEDVVGLALWKELEFGSVIASRHGFTVKVAM
jgi:cytolysin-activating lysine-acyltransferase